MQRQLDDALMLITDLSGCNSDSETLSRLKKVFSILGIPSFLFVTFQLDDEARASDYRFLVGCNPEWIQIYQHRHWYSNDPYLQYGRTHASPAPGSKIPIASAGQREMIETARRYGLRSTLTLPAHARSTALIGVLLASTDVDAEAGGEELLMRWRSLLRATALELLDGRISINRRAAAAKYALDEREVSALRLVLAAEPAQEVARTIGLSVATVYAMYSRINEKFGVPRINEAARRAERFGLL
ncbi:hypothetical protein WI38_16260 [Burkholderia ubonensis]|uniref:HTH luxR-type domain-containing protein n=1 Tax=Burkholderia ubonensis TaxID=101571 RepID=A0A102M123_9BURK|nr:autoinducer binding domain-containing protein [Burkholderia ubonensis]KUZ69369.1 hypothetical protein WI35_01555 [Burkholderia ubonensis]KUZ89705.1 hypothetical protein WI38_16260 [Burkholderia ubonensis]KVA03477.1 hypothetical protein WI39_31495 [Burkholderia ubonensis]